MPANSLVKPALLATILTFVAFGFWKHHLRLEGVVPYFDNDAVLWASKRAKVFEPADKATVILGSSRGAYDIDIPTYERMTGKHAIQLSMGGSSPRSVFDDLANDPRFKGKIILDVTEGQFFSNIPFVLTTPTRNLNYYKAETPAQKVSFALNTILESNLHFLTNIISR